MADMTAHEDEENVDWEAALGSVSGRRDLLTELVEIFLAECPALLADIAKAIETDAANELTVNAHRLKGSLRYFGNSVAAERSAELEIIGRERRLAEADAKFEEVKTALGRLLPRLRKGP
ncbi:MAG: Hpt domain-containing protein [Pirellulaceae bacterium]